MSEDLEWQPVRIAPESQRRSCPTFQDKNYWWPAGKIVRVMPVAVSKDDQHQKLAFKVHPEDDFGPSGLLCEHQIQAD